MKGNLMRDNDSVPKITWACAHRGTNGSKVMRDAELNNEQAYVYHMLPWPYAKEIFEKGRLRLSPVQSWKDPYEKWWCDTLFGGENNLSGVQAYGLCWTSSTFDEPLWRLAAFGRTKKHPIVRIRCKLTNILRAGQSLIGTEDGSLYLGKVRYQRQRKLENAARIVKTGRLKDVSRTAASMLLQKRNAFRFEQEIRLLWLDRHEERKGFFIKVDPASDIDQIMTSPYATRKQHQEIKTFVDGCCVECRMSAILAPRV